MASLNLKLVGSLQHTKEHNPHSIYQKEIQNQISTHSSSSNIKSGTKRGLFIINVCLWIHLAAVSLFIIAMVLSLNGESSFSYVKYADGAVVLYLIGLSLFTIGFGYMFFWSKEFGNKHTYRVYLASIFMVIAFLIFFIYAFVILTKNFSDLFIADSDLESQYAYHTFIFGLRDIFMFFFHLLISLMWVFLVYELASHRQRRVLLLYFVISICIYLAAAFIKHLYNLEELNVEYPIESSSIVGSIILMYCYGMIYARIRKGEIEPVPTNAEFPPFFPFRYLNEILKR
jgi:hypothetical protein